MKKIPHCVKCGTILVPFTGICGTCVHKFLVEPKAHHFSWHHLINAPKCKWCEIQLMELS